MKIKLSKWAEENGVCYHTAYKWFHEGKIKNAVQLDTGTILIEKNNVDEKVEKTFIYARVSNQSRKKEMEYQVNRICEFASANGYSVDKIFKEIAQFWKMIESNPTRIIVENKDRLTRFGFKYLKNLLAAQGCKIIVINKNREDEADLMKDLVSIITSLYGTRRGINKAQKLKKFLLS